MTDIQMAKMLLFFMKCVTVGVGVGAFIIVIAALSVVAVFLKRFICRV